MKTSIAMLAIAGLAGTAAAQSFSGAGFAIPDNNPAGASSSIVTSGGAVQGLTVTLEGLNHTWVGDLIITLSNGSSTIDLARRTGSGGVGVGFSWNLAGNYTFDDAAATSWEDFGNPGSLVNLPSGSYSPTGSLASFNGGSFAGTWTLFVSDNAGLDVGGFTGWTITNVPAPSAVALLGLGGVVAGRRRRA